MVELPAHSIFLLPDESRFALHTAALFRQRYNTEVYSFSSSRFLTAGLLFGFLKKRSGTTYALIGFLMFLSTPVIVKLSITVYVDLGLVFFSTAALIYLIKWNEAGFSIRFLLFSAAFCGLALGTKYNGLVTFFLLTIFVPFIYLRSRPALHRHQGKATGFAAIYVLTALLVFSPWMIRNAYWTGNPIYPLYNRIFSTASTAKQTHISEDLQHEVEPENRRLESFGHPPHNFQRILGRDRRDSYPYIFSGTR